MLTTITPGQAWRQWAFFALLFVPIFGLMFVLGVFTGRATTPTFPLVLCAAILGTIGTIVVLGINYRIGLYMIMYFVMWDRITAIGSSGNLTATKIIIGLTLIFLTAAILNREIPDWWRKLGDPLAILGALFLLFSVLALPYVSYADISLPILQRRVNVIVLMMLILVIVTDRDILHRTALFLVIGGATVAIATTSEIITGVGLLERLGRSDPERIGSGLNTLGTFGGRTRIVGPSGDPTFYGLAQSLPGVLTMGMILYYRELWKKILLSLALIIIAINIAGTGSRAGALSFGVGIVVVLLVCPVRHRFLKLCAVALAGLAGLAALYLSGADVAAQRIAMPTAAVQTVDIRIALWKMAVDQFEMRPLVGVGTNGFGYWYYMMRDAAAPNYLQRPLNAFLELLAENGVQNMIVYTLFYLAAAGSAICAGLGTHDRRLKFEAMALAAISVGFFVFAGTSNVLQNELYYIVFGMCGAAYHVYRRERDGDSRLGEDLLTPAPVVQEIAALQRRQAQAYSGR